MKECVIDTDILSYYMRGIPQIVTMAQEYLKQFGCFNVSSLTIFEILKGLRKKSLLQKVEIFQSEMLKHKLITDNHQLMTNNLVIIVSETVTKVVILSPRVIGPPLRAEGQTIPYGANKSFVKLESMQ